MRADESRTTATESVTQFRRRSSRGSTDASGPDSHDDRASRPLRGEWARPSFGARCGFYESVERELAAVGFETLGDFEDAALVVTDISKKSFVRFALGAHGAIAAMWFEVPAVEGEPVQCLVLHSWLAEGRVFVTARGTIDNGLPMPSALVVERVDATVDTRSTLRIHGERVAATGQAPLRLSDAGELFAHYANDERALAEFRQQLGVQLFEPMLRTMLGENFQVQASRFSTPFSVIPEWMARRDQRRSRSAPRRGDPRGSDRRPRSLPARGRGAHPRAHRTDGSRRSLRGSRSGRARDS